MLIFKKKYIYIFESFWKDYYEKVNQTFNVPEIFYKVTLKKALEGTVSVVWINCATKRLNTKRQITKHRISKHRIAKCPIAKL
jgi:hypothetical protein